jgi:REP element-mobilizing transposase RayT
MEKFQNKYCIPSARANWHNYNGGVYFVTICTKNREHYFGEICPGPQMQLSPIGQYVYEQFINVKTHYPYAKIPLFVIMPDHIHAIVTIDGENEIGGNGMHTQCRDVARNVCNENIARDACGNGVHAQCGDVARNVSTGVNTQMANISPRKNSLAVVIRGVKSSITKFANENKIPFAWQTRFHDRIIRNQAELDRISDYIEKNVVNWHDDLSS